MNRINLGEMPPPKATQPTTDERRVLVDWMTASLRKAAAARRFAAGRVVTRRLTRYEYQHTMQDLLGVQLDFARHLPPEPASPDGFLNNGATLEMSPVQIEAALEAARRGLAEAIVSGDQPPVFEHHADRTAVGKLPQKKVAGHEPVQPEFIMDLDPFPRHGEFEIRVQAGAIVADGDDFPRLRLSLGCVPGIIHVPRKQVGEVDVTGSLDEPQTIVFRGRIEDYPQPGDKPFGNVSFDGMIAIFDFVDADGRQLRYNDRPYATRSGKKKGAKGKKQPDDVGKANNGPLPRDRTDIVIKSADFRAPVFRHWPPPSHTRILGERNDGNGNDNDGGSGNDNKPDDRSYVRDVLGRFMTRAFRRPVQDDEVAATAALFDKVRSSTPTFEEAMRETLASVLVSPHFLYIVETRDGDPGQHVRLTDFELATRLSYFLWSSLPDARLFDLARDGKLHDAQTLEAEVDRMLSDSRAERFVTNWADQWLDLSGLDRVAVNPEFFPDFEDGLKRDMRAETIAFLGEILRQDESALNLIDSDWAMLNRAMARHYGVIGPRSTRFERVSLQPADRRGGLLGQAAFLLSNSNGESSHPIKRAVWMLDRMLDSAPAPPPPDVPELNEDSPDLAGLSLSQQLAVHRRKESCANCHRGIDGWGIPLENYDAVGRWRTEVVPASNRKRKPAAIPVDATSELPDGTRVDGIDELKRYLRAERGELFARSVVKRLAIYGLGRSLDLGDNATIQRLTQRFVKSDYRLKSLIVELVRSEAFATK